MNAIIVVAAALAFSSGVILATTAWTSPPTPTVGNEPVDRGSIAFRAAATVGAAAAALLLTGWIVGLLAGAVVGWKASGAWIERGRTAAIEQSRIEALAAWCQQLRDLLSADKGPLGTVVATVPVCPAAIRPEVSRLATRIQRQEPAEAFRQFAVELDDSSGDLVASVLELSMSHSGRTADLLSELATTIQDRATMRLRVEADRAGQRSEGRMVIGISVAVVALIVVFGRDTTFLGAYDDTSGQLALAIIAAMFFAGVAWLNRLTRFTEPARFLTIGRRR